MIKSLSPHYINVPLQDAFTLVICQKYTLKIYIWEGLKNEPPTEANYEITKFNPTSSTGSDTINISRYVNDFIIFGLNSLYELIGTTTQLVNGNNQKWVKTEIYYDDSNVPTNVTTALMLRGYGYAMDGGNPQTPSNKILIPVQEYKVNRNGKFIIPILINEPPIEGLILTITLVEEAIEGLQYDITYTTNRIASTDVTFYYRETGEEDWFIFSDTVSSLPYELATSDISGGDYEFMISIFDAFTSTTVYSNVYNLVV